MIVLIKKLCGLHLPIRAFASYLHSWAFSTQRPAQVTTEIEPAQIRAWMRDDNPGIVARTKLERAKILCADKTEVRKEHHWLRGCAPARKKT